MAIPPALLATLNAGDLVPFLGAGVSMVPPTSLPSASELAADLVDQGFGSTGDDLEEVAEWCWQRGGWQMFPRALPTEEWRARQPNVCHAVIAEFAAEGLLLAILTTNWDTMLEMALNDCGVPFARIAEPEDLAVSSALATQVIKLHGCIDTPRTIRARRTVVDSDEWAADWAGAVFAVTLRTKSVLFVGYSGASRATTRTIERVSLEAARSRLDWMVGRVPFDEAITRDRTAHLLEALGADQGGYLNMETPVFFTELRGQMYPLLLNRPKHHARQLVEALFEPTEIVSADVMAAVEQVVATWKDAGQPAGQRALQQAVPGRQQRGYVPIVPNAKEIGTYWAWIGTAIWAEAVTLEPGTLRAEVSSEEFGPVPIVPVICSPTDRCGETAATALGLLADAGTTPYARYVGLVVGGNGPIDSPDSSYSVARGIPMPDVVRGGAVEVDWIKPDGLFDLARRDVASDEFGEAVQSHLSRLIERAAPGSSV